MPGDDSKALLAECEMRVDPAPACRFVDVYGIERSGFNTSDQVCRTIGKLKWPAVLRKLDRIDESYKF